MTKNVPSYEVGQRVFVPWQEGDRLGALTELTETRYNAVSADSKRQWTASGPISTIRPAE